ncbi:MAG TPA: RsmG family class I SAM-dependent methyltransferase [Vicinamibacteria bacterium]|nr:RsmG family class I SAM-dependent methyltransferase [Vicinamibacteria bacterium]
MPEPPSAHRHPLEALGLPAAATQGLAAYLDLLAAWTRRVNLTGARTPAERVALLVAPVVPAAPWPAPGRLIDVGAGNGSPGLVLALLRPDLEVTLLEPRQKRWAFLREAGRAAGRPDLTIRRERHDAYPGPPAATVTLRALALPLPALVPLVIPGGRVLVFGGRPRAAEGWAEEPPGPGFRVFRRNAVAPENVSR